MRSQRIQRECESQAKELELLITFLAHEVLQYENYFLMKSFPSQRLAVMHTKALRLL